MVNCAKNLAEIETVSSSDINQKIIKHDFFEKLCIELKMRKDRKEKFRTNLYFSWKQNSRDLKDRVKQEFLRRRTNNNSRDDHDDSDDDFEILSSQVSSMSVSDLEIPAKNSANYSGEDSGDDFDQDLDDSGDDSDENSQNSDSPVTKKKAKRREYHYTGTISTPTDTITRDNRLSPSGYRSILQKVLPDSLDIGCLLIFNGTQHGENGRFRDYAHCKQPQCAKRFKFLGEIKGAESFIRVYPTVGTEIHTEDLNYSLKGEAREYWKEKLKTTQPITVFEELCRAKNCDVDWRILLTLLNVLLKQRAITLTFVNTHHPLKFI
uniref:Uncharacterized protein n=1 Tax=Bracon brevicornis TaxID=1563983 RepID=A0A6V7KRV5_9HYME